MTTMMPQRRSGFTLIELLVVIAIIGVLVGLAVGAVQQVRKRGKEAETLQEIQQLATACGKFKQDFGFNVPESFTFPATANTSDPNYVLLTRMFRSYRHNPGDALTFTFRGTNVTGQTIRGSQCIAYFLGGPELTGFAMTGPVAPAPNATTKKGPYFDFQLGRFSAPGSSDRLSYRDPYGTAYAFFSCSESGKYNPNFVLTFDNPENSSVEVRPYATNLNNGALKWVNDGGVQIISAGHDKCFGPGIKPASPSGFIGWDPKSGDYSEQKLGSGFDDLANFNNGMKLGVSGGN